MSFSALRKTVEGRIVLVNLDRMVRERLLPVRVLKPAIRELYAQLELQPRPGNWRRLKQRIGSALLPNAASVQIRGTQKPSDTIEICAVVGFDKITKVLDKIVQRNRKYGLKVQMMKAPGARDTTVAASAKLINDHLPGNPDFTLSEWGTIFWAAPSIEFDRFLALCSATFPSEEVATRLRDAFGLVQIPGTPNPDHLFLFKSKVSLRHLRKVAKLEFQFARPTTLDGWDNVRFCQHLPVSVPVRGCGLTIDLQNFTFAPGASELVMTPIILQYFECHYVGRIRALRSGSDADFLSLLRGADKLDDMVARLDALATN